MQVKIHKRKFLARNPFPYPRTMGFFYREKMDAIWDIAPDTAVTKVLELGGGESGLTSLLYPSALIVNLDLDPRYANSPCNQRKTVRFLAASATRLPFPDGAFDAVTMFDVIEHIAEDERAMEEAVRVLKPGGMLLVTTPNQNWRFPYYPWLKRFCPAEEEIMAQWGHMRKGYSVEQLQQLTRLECTAKKDFITTTTVFAHDIAFSRQPHLFKRALCTALAPFTWLAYWM